MKMHIVLFCMIFGGVLIICFARKLYISIAFCVRAKKEARLFSDKSYIGMIVCVGVLYIALMVSSLCEWYIYEVKEAIAHLAMGTSLSMPVVVFFAPLAFITYSMAIREGIYMINKNCLRGIGYEIELREINLVKKVSFIGRTKIVFVSKKDIGAPKHVIRLNSKNTKMFQEFLEGI